MSKFLRIFLFLGYLSVSFLCLCASWAMEKEFEGKTNATHYLLRPMQFTQQEESALREMEMANATHITSTKSRPFFNFIREEGSFRTQGFFLHYCEELQWTVPCKNWVVEDMGTKMLVAELFVMFPTAQEASIIVHPSHQGQGIAQKMYEGVYDYTSSKQNDLEPTLEECPSAKAFETDFDALGKVQSYEEFKGLFSRMLEEGFLTLQQKRFQGLFVSIHIENTPSLRAILPHCSFTHTFLRKGLYEDGIHAAFSLQNWGDIEVKDASSFEEELRNPKGYLYWVLSTSSRWVHRAGNYGGESILLSEEICLSLSLFLKSLEDTTDFKRVELKTLSCFLPGFQDHANLLKDAASLEEPKRARAFTELQKRFPDFST